MKALENLRKIRSIVLDIMESNELNAEAVEARKCIFKNSYSDGAIVRHDALLMSEPEFKRYKKAINVIAEDTLNDIQKYLSNEEISRDQEIILALGDFYMVLGEYQTNIDFYEAKKVVFNEDTNIWTLYYSSIEDNLTFKAIELYFQLTASNKDTPSVSDLIAYGDSNGLNGESFKSKYYQLLKENLGSKAYKKYLKLLSKKLSKSTGNKKQIELINSYLQD